jgi:hypothetical protein
MPAELKAMEAVQIITAIMPKHANFIGRSGVNKGLICFELARIETGALLIIRDGNVFARQKRKASGQRPARQLRNATAGAAFRVNGFATNP